ncbi:hypothetical protein GCM10009591_38920 [Brachybacterium tyrofermentans]
MPFAVGAETFARILPPSVVSSPANRVASNRASMLSDVMVSNPVTVTNSRGRIQVSTGSRPAADGIPDPADGTPITPGLHPPPN